ncbi:thiamine-binding protein [Schleiferiaceae bacterium]|nr:thiamine-binding protein [Schleiferiaceae bacterium]
MDVLSANIQFIPLHSENPMAAVDEAIALIQSVGVSYEVGPFGTSVEGDIDAVNNLIHNLQKSAITKEFLLNVQYHVGGDKLSNEEKIAKFR